MSEGDEDAEELLGPEVHDHHELRGLELHSLDGAECGEHGHGVQEVRQRDPLPRQGEQGLQRLHRYCIVYANIN